MHDPRYLQFFECFNRGEYFQAHEVLEGLWLPVRGCAEAAFYQGLIQLAGAFVHLRKGRFAPAARLLTRAGHLLSRYPGSYAGLDLGQVHALITAWLGRLKTAGHSAEWFNAQQPPALPVPGALRL